MTQVAHPLLSIWAYHLAGITDLVLAFRTQDPLVEEPAERFTAAGAGFVCVHTFLDDPLKLERLDLIAEESGNEHTFVYFEFLDNANML